MTQQLHSLLTQIASHSLRPYHQGDKDFYMKSHMDILQVIKSEKCLDTIETRIIEHHKYWLQTKTIKWAFWSSERKYRCMAYEHAFEALDGVRRRNGL